MNLLDELIYEKLGKASSTLTRRTDLERSSSGEAIISPGLPAVAKAITRMKKKCLHSLLFISKSKLLFFRYCSIHFSSGNAILKAPEVPRRLQWVWKIAAVLTSDFTRSLPPVWISLLLLHDLASGPEKPPQSPPIPISPTLIEIAIFITVRAT